MGGGNCAMLTVYQELSRGCYLSTADETGQRKLCLPRQIPVPWRELQLTLNGYRLQKLVHWMGRGGVRLTMKCSLFIKPNALSTILVANQLIDANLKYNEFSRGHAKKKEVRIFMPPSDASYWKIKETKRISSITFSGLYQHAQLPCLFNSGKKNYETSACGFKWSETLLRFCMPTCTSHKDIHKGIKHTEKFYYANGMPYQEVYRYLT